MKRKILVALAVIVILAGGAVGYAYARVHQVMDNVYTEVESDSLREEDASLKKGQPISILLLGIDKDEDRPDAGRSDTMLVVTINPKLKSTKMVSIARDSRVEIVGKGFMDKINHAYAFGGAAMSINTVQNLLDIPIDYYAEIDMDGLTTLVDAVGGITVNNDTVAFEEHGYYFPLGEVTMDGPAALAFSRMRYQDPSGDIGRQARQRLVLMALVQELITLNPAKWQSIADAVGSHMKTSISMDELVTLSTRYLGAMHDVESLQLYGPGQMINGVYYGILEPGQIEELSHLLQEHLQLNN